MPKWLKCARRPEMARAPTKLSARNIRTIIIHKTIIIHLLYEMEGKKKQAWSNKQQGKHIHYITHIIMHGEPFWHANVLGAILAR